MLHLEGARITNYELATKSLEEIAMKLDKGEFDVSAIAEDEKWMVFSDTAGIIANIDLELFKLEEVNRFAETAHFQEAFAVVESLCFVAGNVMLLVPNEASFFDICEHLIGASDEYNRRLKACEDSPENRNLKSSLLKAAQSVRNTLYIFVEKMFPKFAVHTQRS